VRGVVGEVGSSSSQSKRKSKAKHSEGQDVPQLAHFLYAFSPTAAILGLSREGRNTERTKRKSPNCQPSDCSLNSSENGDKPLHAKDFTLNPQPQLTLTALAR
jgi:hypothetical protein